MRVLLCILCVYIKLNRWLLPAVSRCGKSVFKLNAPSMSNSRVCKYTAEVPGVPSVVVTFCRFTPGICS